jgi:hypothetical protein
VRTTRPTRVAIRHGVARAAPVMTAPRLELAESAQMTRRLDGKRFAGASAPFTVTIDEAREPVLEEASNHATTRTTL